MSNTEASSATFNSHQRVCNEQGCATLLSRYNDLDFCALHAPMIIPRMRGKVLEDNALG